MNVVFHAIVQGMAYQCLLKDWKRKNRIQESSHLCWHWLLNAEEVIRGDLSVPNLSSILVETIQTNALVAEEEPGLCRSWQGNFHLHLISGHLH